MEADVREVDHPGAHRTLVVNLRPLKGAEDLQSLAYFPDKILHGGGVRKGGVAADQRAETVVHLAGLDSGKKGVQLLLDRGGWRLGIGISRQKLGNEGGDGGRVVGSIFLLLLLRGGGCRHGQQKHEDREGVHGSR